MARSGNIYLIHAEGTHRYKIGKTTRCPYLRLEELNREQSPFDLKLVNYYQTDDIDYQESRLHNLAGKYKVRNEWFEIPRWWLYILDKWFSAPSVLSEPKIKDLTSTKKWQTRKSIQEIIKNQEIRKTASNLVFRLTKQQLRWLHSRLNMYLYSADPEYKLPIERLIGFKIPSRQYARHLKASLKEIELESSVFTLIKDAEDIDYDLLYFDILNNS